jgi:hypothetical protein
MKSSFSYFIGVAKIFVFLSHGKRAYHFDGIDVLPLNDFLERLYEGEIFKM